MKRRSIKPKRESWSSRIDCGSASTVGQHSLLQIRSAMGTRLGWTAICKPSTTWTNKSIC